MNPRDDGDPGRGGASEPEYPAIPVAPDPPPIPEVLRGPAGGRPRGRDPDAPGALFSDTTKAWAIAMDFVFTILGALLLGYFADRWFGTAPKAALGGLVLGFAFALWRIIRRTLADDKREKEEREKSRSGSR